MAALTPERPSSARAWLLATRPRTLLAAVGPVAVGTAVASSEGGARFGPALAALLGALLLQVVSNFANDLFDFEKGADNEARLGPARATQMGWLSPTQMRVGIACAIAAAVLVGLYLVSVGGWPVVAIGILSIAAALAYTGGPRPFGYVGLGDPAVFLFFGVIAVVGTAYVQTGAFSWAALAASLPVGAVATAILVVNNLRDIDSDRDAGKITLAVRFGATAARREYSALIVFAYVAPGLLAIGGMTSAWVLLPWLTAPLAVTRLRAIWRDSGPALNPLLGATAQLGLLHSLLLALGFWV